MKALFVTTSQLTEVACYPNNMHLEFVLFKNGKQLNSKLSKSSSWLKYLNTCFFQNGEYLGLADNTKDTDPGVQRRKTKRFQAISFAL